MRNKKTRVSAYTSLGLFLAFAVAASGCSKANDQASSSSGAAPGSAAAPQDKTIELKMISWQGQNQAYWNAYDEAIKDYMALHPNVKIEHIFQPLANDGYNKLLDTQFVAHKAPDLIDLQGANIGKYTDQDYIIPLDPYLGQPTAYSDGTNWVDTFIGGDSGFSNLKTTNKYGAISFVPVDNGPGIAENRPFYYNKDLLAKAGVTAMPQTWNEFIEVLKKVKAAGITPIAADNNRWVKWITSWTSDQFVDGYLNQYFEDQFKDARALDDAKRNLAVLTGKVDKTNPVVNAEYDLLKEFSQYWQDGWAGVDDLGAQQLFLYQQAAFIVDGNWNYNFYKENIHDFEWGIMPFPLITKETTPYAAEGFPMGDNKLGAEGWALNKDLEKDPDKLKAAVDFLQYLTSKDAQQKFVQTAMTISSIVGVEAPEELKPFIVSDKATLSFPAKFLLFEGEVNGVALSQQFYMNKMSKEEFLSKMQESVMNKALKDAKAQLDQETGIPRTIASVEKDLADLKASSASQVLIDDKQSTLDFLKLKLELYQKYAGDTAH
ncbi:ABC transporter substrate-binding protein [Cohnella sp. 56]|uniref:ABC transporter substrate-binding protein n=1 Tax=Cohnella sp. 56 TaxID=3113722 RepID=UPI0030E8ED93